MHIIYEFLAGPLKTGERKNTQITGLHGMGAPEQLELQSRMLSVEAS